MKIRMAAAALAVLAAGGVVLASVRQEEGWQPPKPGKFHEFLKQFEGSWEAASEWVQKPGDTPMKSKGTESARLVVNGLFVVSEFKGDMMGMEFSGMSLMGYDQHKKKYTGSWVDSMSTAIWTIEGSVDDAGKVFTSFMEGPNPMDGKPMKMRYVTEITGKDSRKMSFYMNGEDGKEFQVGKMEYTRKK